MNAFFRVKNFTVFIHAINFIEYYPPNRVEIHMLDDSKFIIGESVFDELIAKSKIFYELIFGNPDKVKMP